MSVTSAQTAALRLTPDFETAPWSMPSSSATGYRSGERGNWENADGGYLSTSASFPVYPDSRYGTNAVQGKSDSQTTGPPGFVGAGSWDEPERHPRQELRKMPNQCSKQADNLFNNTVAYDTGSPTQPNVCVNHNARSDNDHNTSAGTNSWGNFPTGHSAGNIISAQNDSSQSSSSGDKVADDLKNLTLSPLTQIARTSLGKQYYSQTGVSRLQPQSDPAFDQTITSPHYLTSPARQSNTIRPRTYSSPGPLHTPIPILASPGENTLHRVLESPSASSLPPVPFSSRLANNPYQEHGTSPYQEHGTRYQSGANVSTFPEFSVPEEVDYDAVHSPRGFLDDGARFSPGGKMQYRSSSKSLLEQSSNSFLSGPFSSSREDLGGTEGPSCMSKSDSQLPRALTAETSSVQPPFLGTAREGRLARSLSCGRAPEFDLQQRDLQKGQSFRINSDYQVRRNADRPGLPLDSESLPTHFSDPNPSHAQHHAQDHFARSGRRTHSDVGVNCPHGASTDDYSGPNRREPQGILPENRSHRPFVENQPIFVSEEGSHFGQNSPEARSQQSAPHNHQLNIGSPSYQRYPSSHNISPAQHYGDRSTNSQQEDCTGSPSNPVPASPFQPSGGQQQRVFIPGMGTLIMSTTVGPDGQNIGHLSLPPEAQFFNVVQQQQQQHPEHCPDFYQGGPHQSPAFFHQQQHHHSSHASPKGRSHKFDDGRNYLGHSEMPEHMLPHSFAQIGEVGSDGFLNPAPRVIYNVKFKRTQRSFILGDQASQEITVGTYVKVEADRGEDLGVVHSRLPAEGYKGNGASRGMETAGLGGGGIGCGSSDLKQILRPATKEEISLLDDKTQEEDSLLKICRSKVRQRGLNMNVVDAEYQFDRHKVIFFFEAEGRVDFRELVRDLFSIYKTRIWMQQIDKTNSSIMKCCTSPCSSFED